jgi:hypothetical protein
MGMSKAGTIHWAWFLKLRFLGQYQLQRAMIAKSHFAFHFDGEHFRQPQTQIAEA